MDHGVQSNVRVVYLQRVEAVLLPYASNYVGYILPQSNLIYHVYIMLYLYLRHAAGVDGERYGYQRADGRVANAYLPDIINQVVVTVCNISLHYHCHYNTNNDVIHDRLLGMRDEMLSRRFDVDGVPDIR